ncbi:MAG: NAD-dependent epimerase/dehydratase family protein [Anaerolineae bacterium]
MGQESGARVLVIGGSGFVSGTVARTAVAQSNRVTVVTRGQRGLPDGVTGIVADRQDREGFAKAVAAAGGTWDYVLDCIGFKADDARQDVEVFRGRTPRLLFISTDFVYDPAYRKFPQPEEENHFLTDDSYGANKRRCEEVLLGSDLGDMRYTIIRPCHIYGPGSQLGCLPRHGRDRQLIARLRAGEALELVGAGYFLQQPIFVRDLAEFVLSARTNANSFNQIYNMYGPDIIESRYYYKVVADYLGVPLKITELPVDRYREEHPEELSFFTHRIASLDKMRAHGLRVPATPIEQGLREQTEALLSAS